jgi:hypothetical protein
MGMDAGCGCVKCTWYMQGRTEMTRPFSEKGKTIQTLSVTASDIRADESVHALSIAFARSLV